MRPSSGNTEHRMTHRLRAVPVLVLSTPKEITMNTVLFNDPFYGTKIEVIEGRDETTVRVTEASALAPGGKHTATLNLDDVDRLLAVREHAVNPEDDIAEFFRNVFHYGERQSFRAAEAFVQSAGSLAETIR